MQTTTTTNRRWPGIRAQRVRRVDNQSRIPTERLTAIVAFVRPSGLQKFVVRYRNRKNVGGHGGYGSALVRVPPATRHYPIHWQPGNGYLGSVVYTEDEYLVYLTAHELRHVEHSAKGNRMRRVWGAGRSGFSERDADAYAIQMVRRWRRLGMPQPGARLQIPRRAPVAPPAAPPDPAAAKVAKAAAEHAKLVAARKRWATKAKRAATALRKIDRRMKRLAKIVEDFS